MAGTGNRKWHKSRPERRLRYLELALERDIGLEDDARRQVIRVLESERNWSEAIIESQKLIDVTSDQKTVTAEKETLAMLRTLKEYASPAADMCTETLNQPPAVLSWNKRRYTTPIHFDGRGIPQ